MRNATPALAIVIAVLATSCGGSDEDSPAPGTSAGADGGDGLLIDLRVTVMPEGSGGPERVRRIECAKLGEDAVDPRCRDLGELDPQDLDPVPGRTACTQIYRGPATARVTGALRGARVSASFDLTDGCEIDRWRRNAALLEPPPGPRPTSP